MARKAPKSRRFLIESGLLQDIPRTKARYQKFLQYHWKLYSELAFQRAQVQDALKASLRTQARPKVFERWQRAVKYRYSLDPLSTEGSRRSIGGRFNIGEIDPARFSVFGALYLASDRQTAEDELFARDKQGRPLNAEELALTRRSSMTIVSLSGSLESVIDLHAPRALAGFAEIIKNFTFSPEVLAEARQLQLRSPRLVLKPEELAESFRSSYWRFLPMQCDVPAVSQVFGQIVADAGIEGILYPSSLTKAPCLAVFPQNFANTASFIQIDDPAPPACRRKRIDASNGGGE
jgi:RES domain-containing protein